MKRNKKSNPTNNIQSFLSIEINRIKSEGNIDINCFFKEYKTDFVFVNAEIPIEKQDFDFEYLESLRELKLPKIEFYEYNENTNRLRIEDYKITFANFGEELRLLIDFLNAFKIGDISA